MRTQDDRIRGVLIERLLSNAIVRKDAIGGEFGIDFEAYFRPELEALVPFEADGLVQVSDGAIRVTELGRIFIRVVAQVFDRYHASTIASRAV